MNRYRTLAAVLVAAATIAPSTASASPRPYERDHATAQKVVNVQKHVRQLKPDTNRHLSFARPYGRG